LATGFAKSVEVKFTPVEGDLESVAELGDAAITTHGQSAGDTGVDAAQPKVELIESPLDRP
jgi:hypothetical protein